MWGSRRRELQRYRTLARVLARHGLGQLGASLGLSRWPAIAPGWSGRTAPADWMERVPWILADLGSTFVKLGQLASMRTDLMPARLASALEQLQDHAAPLPVADVRAVLRRAWGADPDSVLWLDPDALASASIAQVHAGQLPDGRAVVVKVRRPGIVATAQVDGEIVTRLAAVAEARLPWARQYDVSGLVGELVPAFLAELDLTVEGHHTDEAGRRARGDPGVRIPEVVWALSGPEVLVLTRLDGAKITDAATLAALGLDPHQVAARLVHTLYRQIFVDGFFHADPHPGNVHVDPDGRLILLDWGMVGRLSPGMREHSIDLLLGMARGNSALVVRALLALGAVAGPIDRAALTADVERLRRRYYDSPLAQFRLGQALADVLGLAARHRIRIPREYALLAKAAVTLDGLVRRLDPNASLVEMGRPLVAQLLRSRFGPAAAARHLEDNAWAWLALGDGLPDRIDRVLDRMESGLVRVELEPNNLARLLGHWERLVDRAARAMVASALVVGTALVVHRHTLDHMFGAPVGEYAFLGAAGLALAVWVAGLVRSRG